MMELYEIIDEIKETLELKIVNKIIYRHHISDKRIL